MAKHNSLIAGTCPFLIASLTWPSPAARAEEPRAVLSGFIDSALLLPLTDPDIDFSVNLVELDVAAQLERLALQVDLNFRPDDASDPALMLGNLIEQAFARFDFLDTSSGPFIMVGRWNAPIGVESPTPSAKWHQSYGLLYTYATPANLTGLALGWTSGQTDARLWLTDEGQDPASPDDLHIGGRIQQTLGSLGTLGLSAMYGAVSASQPRLLLDLDALLTFGDLRLTFEASFAMQGSEHSLGFILAGNFAASDAVSMTARVDWLDRPFADSPYHGASATLASLFALSRGLLLVTEVRADLPSSEAASGEDAENQWTAAIELIASF